MRKGSSLVMLFTGLIAGIALVLSCSDDSPGPADAATCDCAPAEAPISGRIMNVSNTQEIAANDRDGNGVSCPSGAVMLSGSCTTADGTTDRDVTLEQSGFYANEHGWQCRFKNNEATPVMVKITARCLMPAQ